MTLDCDSLSLSAQRFPYQHCSFDSVAPYTQVMPELGAKSTGGPQIDLPNVHLLTLIQFQRDPSFQIIQTPQPQSEIMLTCHPGRLSDHTAASLVTINPSIHTAVEVRCIDPHNRDEVIE